MTGRTRLRRALFSIYGREGLEEPATALHAAGVELVSTGSTTTRIAAAGILMTLVGQLTGLPECLDGYIKALHPHIHVGTLADRRLSVHASQFEELGVAPLDPVAVNFYPFEVTVASDTGTDERIEQIDIGGPSMMRAATRNHPNAAVITSTSQYPAVLTALAEGGFTLQQRCNLATGAFRHTAPYDIAITSWVGAIVITPAGDGFPVWLEAAWVKKQDLHYGEDSRQAAALYTYSPEPEGIAQAELLHGKPMSYNNYTNDEAAYRAASGFTESCVVIIKYANSCEIMMGSDIAEARRGTRAYDPAFAFGGVITVDHLVTAELAEQIEDIFIEVVIAPGSSPETLAILATRRNLRLLRAVSYTHRKRVLHLISGGVLLQRLDRIDAPGDDPANQESKANEAADGATLAGLIFARRAYRAVKSNAILLAHDGASVDAGMGQVSRVGSRRLTAEYTGERAAGSMATSDAFFPFADESRILIDGDVRAIVQPDGSLRNQETTDLYAEHSVTLYFTGARHSFH